MADVDPASRRWLHRPLHRDWALWVGLLLGLAYWVWAIWRSTGTATSSGRWRS